MWLTDWRFLKLLQVPQCRQSSGTMIFANNEDIPQSMLALRERIDCGMDYEQSLLEERLQKRRKTVEYIRLFLFLESDFWISVSSVSTSQRTAGTLSSRRKSTIRCFCKKCFRTQNLRRRVPTPMVLSQIWWLTPCSIIWQGSCVDCWRLLLARALLFDRAQRWNGWELPVELWDCVLTSWKGRLGSA